MDSAGHWREVPKPLPLSVVIRNAILNALAYTDGQQTEAARYLGLTERQMRYAMRKHRIPSASSKD